MAFSLNTLYAQTSDAASALSAHTVESFLDQTTSRLAKLDEQTQAATDKMLARLQKQEERLSKKVSAKDSSLGSRLFSNTETYYNKLKEKLATTSDTNQITELNEYIPYLDTLKTSLAFLQQKAGDVNYPELKEAQQMLQQYQNRLQITNVIKQEIQEREQLLKDQIQNLGFVKELRNFNKEVYYYQQQLKEYKSLLKDRKKLEQKVIQTICSSPAFQKFWQRNSYLSQIFRLPGNNDNSSEPIPGLQNIASMQQQLQDRFGSQVTINSFTNNASTGGNNPLQDQLQSAQNQLGELKNRLANAGGGNSDMDMPDFKPNQQKTKSFLNRFEWGLDLQSQRGSRFLPALTDFALTLGYKIDDKKVIGVGAIYKMGWGHGFDDIHFTNEGVGLRSYADLKFKAGFWITGGFEYNYFQRFNNFNEIKNIDVWQKSALAGLTKKYKAGKNREGKIQILYDFLHNRQVPATQGLKFRVGWNF